MNQVRAFGIVITLLALPLACPFAASAGPAGKAAPGVPAPAAWKKAGPGLEFRLLDAAAAGGPSGARKGPSLVAVVRFEPARWRVDLHHRSETKPPRAALDAAGWQKETGATVVLNSGQYYPGGGPMGWFIKEGRNLGSRPIKAWKGVLAAGRAGRGPAAELLDLEFDRFTPETSPYGVVLQSFMLLDRTGKKRVRRSDWHANRSVIAEDRSGRLLLLHTEGSWTLWELADWMARSDLQVREALSLDGGFEAQMVVRAGDLAYASFGQFHADDRGDHSMAGLHVPLPAVLTLSPGEARRRGAQGAR